MIRNIRGIDPKYQKHTDNSPTCLCNLSGCKNLNQNLGYEGDNFPICYSQYIFLLSAVYEMIFSNSPFLAIPTSMRVNFSASSSRNTKSIALGGCSLYDGPSDDAW